MADGVRAGVIVLLAVTTIVVVPLVVYAVRLWRREHIAEPPPARPS